jgi:hypothetical protein
LFGLVPDAFGDVRLTCGYRDRTFNGEVDFGSGQHNGGDPKSPATVDWTFQPFGNTIVASARVMGVLYLDRVGFGQSCVRVKVNFQDNAFDNLQGTQEIHFCGPGNNANSNANKESIDLTSNFDARLRRVQITLGQGPNENSIEDLHTGSARAPNVSPLFLDRIENGNADFGFNSHSGGNPASDAHMSLVLANNGRVFGRVNGVLYWDTLGQVQGTSRIVSQFRRRNGTLIGSRTSEVTGPGGDATNILNKILVDHRLEDPNLHQIRLRVGKVVNGNFVNVVNRTYAFACPPP